jgi:hypothetical protein
MEIATTSAQMPERLEYSFSAVAINPNIMLAQG